MAIIEKRVLHGDQNKKVPNKSKKKIAKKKRFIEKVIDYLISDSYLFAHLLPPSKYRSLKGVQVLKRDNKESDKSMVKKVGDYLMSNSYFYSPLVVVPLKSYNMPPKEGQLHFKRVTTVETTARKSILSDKEYSANGRSFDDRFNKNSLAAENIKHTYDILDKEMLNSQKRKLF